MSFSLKDYKKIRTPFVFFDETGSINSAGERFFGLGMIKCMQPYFLDSNIRHLRKVHHCFDEIKWNKVSRLKQAFIKSVIDASLATPGIQFSAMIINKDNVNFATQFSNNPYEAYQDFSEHLLINSIRDNEILTVLADYIDTPKTVQYEIKVKHQVNLQLKRLAIGGIHRVDSKGVNLIQLVDLFLGTVVYNYKLDNKLVSGDKNKIKVLKYLQKKLQLKTFCDGSQSKKFRVFEYNKKGPSSLRLTP